MFNLYRNIIHPYSRIVKVCDSIFRSMNINISKGSFADLLEAHPNYPSLLSIRDTMEFFNVPSRILKLKQERLIELQCPFLVIIKDPLKETETLMIHVTSVNEGFIDFFHPDKRKSISYSQKEFSDYYRGIVIAMESNYSSGERNYDLRKSQERKDDIVVNTLMLFIPIISLLASVRYIYSNSLDKSGYYLLAFFALGLAGWTLSMLILFYERKSGSNNSLISRVCQWTVKSVKSNPLDCDKVLRSSGASLLGVKWSVWGLSYFTSLIATQLIFGFGSSGLSVTLGTLALIASLYIVFSIYYQWKVLKSWCPMCLAIQVILLLQSIFAINLIRPGGTDGFSMETFWTWVASFILVLASTEYLVGLIDDNRSLKVFQKNFLRNKYDRAVFEAKLKNQRTIDSPLDGLGLMFGDPNASNRLVKICNPYCGACRDSHYVINQFLEDMPNISVQIVFAGAKDSSDVRNRPIAHFLALFVSKGEQHMRSALDDWYLGPQKNYDAFAEKHPVKIDESSIKGELNRMSSWCDKMDISYTPTFFFNGYLLPKEYSISDLKRLLV